MAPNAGVLAFTPQLFHQVRRDVLVLVVEPGQADTGTLQQDLLTQADLAGMTEDGAGEGTGGERLIRHERALQAKEGCTYASPYAIDQMH
ncbi:hypothetical protein D3C81_1933160 [compost metagenome]